MAWIKTQNGELRDIHSVAINDAGELDRIYCNDAQRQEAGIYPEKRVQEVIKDFEKWISQGARGIFVFPKE